MVSSHSSRLTTMHPLDDCAPYDHLPHFRGHHLSVSTDPALHVHLHMQGWWVPILPCIGGFAGCCGIGGCAKHWRFSPAQRKAWIANVVLAVVQTTAVIIMLSVIVALTVASPPSYYPSSYSSSYYSAYGYPSPSPSPRPSPRRSPSPSPQSESCHD